MWTDLTFSFPTRAPSDYRSHDTVALCLKSSTFRQFPSGGSLKAGWHNILRCLKTWKGSQVFLYSSQLIQMLLEGHAVSSMLAMKVCMKIYRSWLHEASTLYLQHMSRGWMKSYRVPIRHIYEIITNYNVQNSSNMITETGINQNQ